MRRWLKFKVSLIGLAWLVVFLHSAIPHTHSDELCRTEHKAIHADCQDQLTSFDADGCLIAHSDEDGKVCHFTNNPFLKFAIDFHFEVSSFSELISPQETISSCLLYGKSDLIRPPLIGSLSHRGPPQV